MGTLYGIHGLTVALALLLPLAPSAACAGAAAAAADVSVEIVDPLTLGSAGGLAFGATSRPVSGVRVVTGASATFVVAGSTGQLVHMDVESSVRLDGPDGNSVRLNLTAGRRVLALASDGPSKLVVRCAIPLSAAASGGAYAGAYAVTGVYE